MSRVTFSITPLAASEVPSLLEMIRELARFERLEHEVEATVESLREALFGAKAVAGALLARCGEQLAGYAIYFFTFSSFVGRRGVWLEDVYVRPEFRQQGLGRTLIERVAEIAAESHCGRFEWSALRWNENALRFYRNLGAKPLDNWVLLRMGAPALATLARNRQKGQL